jgi:hypothetical protein
VAAYSTPPPPYPCRYQSNDVRALISHYVQLGFFRHIQTVCDEVIKKRGKDSMLTFWHSYGVGCEGGLTGRHWCEMLAPI